MKIEIDLFRATRNNTLTIINSLTLDQINQIPSGFTGNVAWHVGHMVATHKGLIYGLHGLPSGLEKEFILKYKKGSVPEAPIDQRELDLIKTQLADQITELEQDLENPGQFGPTTEYTTSYNYTITSLEEAVRFSNLHQALHLGYVLALRRSL